MLVHPASPVRYLTHPLLSRHEYKHEYDGAHRQVKAVSTCCLFTAVDARAQHTLYHRCCICSQLGCALTFFHSRFIVEESIEPHFSGSQLFDHSSPCSLSRAKAQQATKHTHASTRARIRKSLHRNILLWLVSVVRTVVQTAVEPLWK